MPNRSELNLLDLLRDNPNGWGNFPPQPIAPPQPVLDEWGQPHDGTSGKPLYENNAPQKTAGESLHDIAMSPINMAMEPVHALGRLSEHGGFPNPSDPQNKQDMSALVMSMFGGNAFAPARAGKLPRLPIGAAGVENHLPMDFESRMARAKEMGFDIETPWYHGTNHDFDTFDYGKLGHGGGGDPGNPMSTHGAFFTKDPDLAASYGRNVKQVYTRGEYPEWYMENANKPEIYEQTDTISDGLGMLKRIGLDGVTLTGPGTHPERVVFDPSKIRSTDASFDPQHVGKNGLLLSDTGKPSALGAAMAGAERQPGIDVWHGSPHDFDKFSLDKIGSGEGAQAYGHGLYTAENRQVAEGYRDALKGQAVNPDRNARLSALSQEMEKYQIPGSYRKYNDPRGAELAAEYDRIMQERADDKGYLYQARINANPEHFLDWDKPLSEQSEHVRKAFPPDVAPELTGSDIHRHLSELLRPNGRPTMAGQSFAHWKDPTPDIQNIINERLVKEGIPGIRYLDQGSRGAGQGSHNYVVFDDSLIDTLHKWRGDEQLYSGGAPGVGAALADQNQQQPTTADLLAILHKHGVKY